MKAMTPMPCLLAVLSALGVVTLFTSAAAQPSEPDLRAGFQQRKQAQEQQVAETVQRKAAECLAAEQRFSELDLYRSSDGSRILGLDLRGRIWMMTNRNGICKLQSSQQLNKPDYSVDWTGQRTWITYHYENNHLCRYQRNPGTQQVRQSCYQPIGVVNRYAPYFLN